MLCLRQILLLGILIIGGTGSAFAQEGKLSIAENQSGQTPSVKPGESLSNSLERNNGVLKPPPTGDSAIETTVPNPDPGTTIVIPPPGTPGGNQNIQPK
jgi:hypothetical protein